MNEGVPADFQILRIPSALFEQPGLYANGSTGSGHKVPVKGIGCRGHALGLLVEKPAHLSSEYGAFVHKTY